MTGSWRTLLFLLTVEPFSSSSHNLGSTVNSNLPVNEQRFFQPGSTGHLLEKEKEKPVDP